MFCFYKFLKYSFVKQLQRYVSDTYVLRNILNLIHGEAGHHTHQNFINLCEETRNPFCVVYFYMAKLHF